MKNLYKYPAYTIIFLLVFTIASPQPDVYAQLKLYDDIGGSQNNTPAQSEGIDNSLIYILGGAIIAGIIIYAVVLKKDNKEKTDTTAFMDESFRIQNVSAGTYLQKEIIKAKEKLPVDLFFGIRNDEAILSKTYLVGVQFRL